MIKRIRTWVLVIALAAGAGFALPAAASAATGSGSVGGGICSTTYHFATYTHSSAMWLTNSTCNLKFRIGIYCVYPLNYHNWVQGPFRYGNGSSTSNYSEGTCNTYGQGSPVDIDLVYYYAGSYHTQRVYTG